MDLHEPGASAEADGHSWELSANRWEAAFRALGEIAAAAAAAPDLHQLAALAVRYMSELVAMSSVALYWWEPDIQALISLADSDPAAVQISSVTPKESVAWQAFERHEPVTVDDYQSFPSAIPALVDAGVLSVTAVPLLCGGEAVGSVSVRSRATGAFDAELVRLLSLFAAQTAPVLQTARLYAQSEERRVEAEEAGQWLRARAFYDPLTGLANRALLEDRVKQAIVLAARRSLDSMALLFVDLDGFKDVNDTMGHETGDEVLRQVAIRLRLAVRDSDTVARYGGDEFVLFLQSLSGPEQAAIAMERVQTTLQAPFLVRDQQLTIGASVGIAAYPTDGSDFRSLLRSADRAMYQAKRESHAS